MTNNDRTRGVFVHPMRTNLDCMEMAYAYDPKDSSSVYILCTEGVGWHVTPDKPDSEFGTVQAILANDANKPEIDLADFVRSFGARLESNFWLWHARLDDDVNRVFV